MVSRNEDFPLTYVLEWWHECSCWDMHVADASRLIMWVSHCHAVHTQPVRSGNNFVWACSKTVNLGSRIRFDECSDLLRTLCVCVQYTMYLTDISVTLLFSFVAFVKVGHQNGKFKNFLIFFGLFGGCGNKLWTHWHRTFYADMVNLIANSYVFAKLRSNVILYLYSCFCPPGEWKSNIHCFFTENSSGWMWL